MNIESAPQLLHNMFADRGLTSKPCFVDAVNAMLDFYRDVRADGCVVEEDGDMLLFQWGQGEGNHQGTFAIDLARQFLRGEELQQLHLELVMPPQAIEPGAVWCGSPDELERFRASIEATAAYAYAARAPISGVDIRLEDV